MAAVLLANVAGLLFGVLLVPLVLFLLVTRFGLLYPRLGRWIDRRVYQAMPRLGHLFMSEEEVSAEDRGEQLKATDDEGSAASGRSAAEDAFGERERR